MDLTARRVGVGVALVLFGGLVLSGLWLSRFSRDESQWIYTARYLTLLTHGQFASPEWDSYWTHTQPPLARYAMGVSLKLGGFNLLKLNGPWDFSKEDSQNRDEGNWPTDAMLAWARLPLTLAAVGAVLLLFLLGRAMGGVAAGLAAAGWFALNPRLRELTTRAESEGLLVFLVLAALLLTLLLVRGQARATSMRGGWRGALLLAALLGVVCGLAASTKLTGAICLASVWATLVVSLLLPRRVAAPTQRTMRLSALVVGQIVVSGVVAFAVFVALNPYLYPDPSGRAISLFQYRQAEMAEQMSQYPTAALNGTVERVGAAIVRPLFTYGLVATNLSTLDKQNGQAIGEKIPLDALLVGLGIVVSVFGLARAFGRRSASVGEGEGQAARRELTRTAGIATLIWTAVSFVALAANLGLDWDRYVILLSLFACVWAGVGIEWLWTILDFRF